MGRRSRPTQLYVPVDASTLERKIELLLTHLEPSVPRTGSMPRHFAGFARLRGMECRAPDGYAEAFFMRKARLEL